jgi:hypothetical protein
MQAELKAWLDDAATEAARVYDEDHANEQNIIRFWDFNETSAELVSALRDAVGEEGQPNIESFYKKLEDNPKLNISAYDFTTEQINMIAKSAYPAYLFALYVLKAPFPDGEEAISRHPFLWGEYSWIMSKFNTLR